MTTGTLILNIVMIAVAAALVRHPRGAHPAPARPRHPGARPRHPGPRARHPGAGSQALRAAGARCPAPLGAPGPADRRRRLTGNSPGAAPGHRPQPVPTGAASHLPAAAMPCAGLVLVYPCGPMARRASSPVQLLVILTLAGCSSGGSPAPASRSATAASTSNSAVACPNADGGVCLGPLQMGTYHTVSFRPRITYTVPAGWGNFEDLPGNFLLIPPEGASREVNPGTSDFLGVYSGIAAEAQACSGEMAAPGIGTAPAQIAAYWARLPAIKVTATRPVTVGGLSGVVVDIVANLAQHAMCPDPSSSWGYQPLLVGVGPASLEHGMTRKLSWRVYLLSWSTSLQGQTITSTIAIEIDDVNGGGHLDAYSQVATTVHFGSDAGSGPMRALRALGRAAPPDTLGPNG